MLYNHCNDVKMSVTESQITDISTVCWIVCSGAHKKTLKLRVTGLCEGNPPVTGGFPSQRASDAENVSIWWRHHAEDMTVHSLLGVMSKNCNRFATKLCKCMRHPFVLCINLELHTVTCIALCYQFRRRSVAGSNPGKLWGARPGYEKRDTAHEIS